VAKEEGREREFPDPARKARRERLLSSDLPEKKVRQV
jgi:hypothetical protein